MSGRLRGSYCLILSAVIISLLVLQFSAYYLPETLSRVVLLTCFASFFLLSSYINIIIRDSKFTYNKILLFVTYVGISFSFIMSRFFLMGFTGLSATRTYGLAQKYSETGNLVFESIRDFLFQHPLMVHFIRTVSGMNMDGVAYVDTIARILLIGLNAAVLNLLIRERIDKNRNHQWYFLVNALAIIVISFSYSERIEFSLVTMFTLMYILLTDWYYDWKKGIILLLLVTGITLGSSTASLMLIPLFFLFSLYEKNFTTTIYGLIPLSYMVYVGRTYTEALGYYSLFAWDGFKAFITAILVGSLPERVLPWNRASLTTLSDTYVTTYAYLSLLVLAGITVLIVGWTWFKEGRLFVTDPEKAYYRSNSSTLFVILGIFVLVYVGASVQPETTYSDIRTIVVVFMTLLVPYIIATRDIITKINKNKLLYFIICILIIGASLRTFYESYPKSLKDPVNVIEDERVSPLSLGDSRDFIIAHFHDAIIAMDYKTGIWVPNSLPTEKFEVTLFADSVPMNQLILYDALGLNISSLHTSQDAYATAINLQRSSDILYNNGEVVLQYTRQLPATSSINTANKVSFTTNGFGIGDVL